MSGLSEVRKRAWETRRKTYGAKGHAGTYRRCNCAAAAWIVRLHKEGVLSEGQASRALNVDRVTLRTIVDTESCSSTSET